MRPELVLTGDGSHTLFLPDMNEHYHSRHGAIRESKHVFIGAGLKHIALSNEIHILEIGFGTGLNALLTFMESAGAGKLILYTSLEPFPLERNVFTQLNYESELNIQAGTLIKMHELPFGKQEQFGTYFFLTKLQSEFKDYETQERFDLLYMDAFAPRVQPELWTKDVFEKAFGLLRPGGILVTYCAKGEVKRNMLASCFEVETLQGPPGKREMIRAIRK